MSDVDKIIKALELFNEKADKLLRLSFINSMSQPDTGITLSWERREDGAFEEKHERRGPDEEAIDAFVLTFRFFIQDNEQSSFRMMAAHYAAAPAEDALKNEFSKVRDYVNAYLDQSSSLNIEYNGEKLIRRKIMDTFVYGGMAHANVAKKALFDEWMSIPPLRIILESEFTGVLAVVLDAIHYLRQLNTKMLEQIQGLSSS